MSSASGSAPGRHRRRERTDQSHVLVRREGRRVPHRVRTRRGRSRDAFVTALEDRLKGRQGTDADTVDEAFADQSDLTAVLDNMAFASDGGLRVVFDRGQVGAAAAGSYVVTPSKATVTPWLSAFGSRAQRQTVRPSRSLDLGATSTPTAVAPTHTAPGDDDTDCKRLHRPDLRRRTRRPGDREPGDLPRAAPRPGHLLHGRPERRRPPGPGPRRGQGRQRGGQPLLEPTPRRSPGPSSTR